MCFVGRGELCTVCRRPSTGRLAEENGGAPGCDPHRRPLAAAAGGPPLVPASTAPSTPLAVELLLPVLSLMVAANLYAQATGPGYALHYDGLSMYANANTVQVTNSGDFAVECWAQTDA